MLDEGTKVVVTLLMPPEYGYKDFDIRTGKFVKTIDQTIAVIDFDNGREYINMKSQTFISMRVLPADPSIMPDDCKHCTNILEGDRPCQRIMKYHHENWPDGKRSWKCMTCGFEEEVPNDMARCLKAKLTDCTVKCPGAGSWAGCIYPF